MSISTSRAIPRPTRTITSTRTTRRRCEGSKRLASTMRVYYGMDGLREHIDSNNLGIHTRDQGGVYASFDARALKRFSFNVGVREELYTAGRQVFSPSVSGAYWVNSRVKLRASASHALPSAGLHRAVLQRSGAPGQSDSEAGILVELRGRSAACAGRTDHRGRRRIPLIATRM